MYEQNNDNDNDNDNDTSTQAHKSIVMLTRVLISMRSSNHHP